MKAIPAFVLLLALPLGAQEDVYKTLSLGDRVQVTFRTGSTVSGHLVAVIRDPKNKVESIDYTRAAELSIDMSWEYTGLNGTMTIPKDQIKKVRRLQHLDPATVRRLQEEKARITAELDQSNQERREANKTREVEARKQALMGERMDIAEADAKDLGERIMEDARKLQEGLALLARFPEPEWGSEKLKEFQAKIIRKQPLTTEENEFLEGFELWSYAKGFKKKQAEGNALQPVNASEGAAPEKP